MKLMTKELEKKFEKYPNISQSPSSCFSPAVINQVPAPHGLKIERELNSTNKTIRDYLKKGN